MTGTEERAADRHGPGSVSYFPPKKREPQLKEALVKSLLFTPAKSGEEAFNDPAAFVWHDNIATD